MNPYLPADKQNIDDISDEISLCCRAEIEAEPDYSEGELVRAIPICSVCSQECEVEKI